MTATIFGNVAFAVTKYRLNGLVIAFFVVRYEVIPVPFLLERNNFGK